MIAIQFSVASLTLAVFIKLRPVVRAWLMCAVFIMSLIR